MTTNYYATTMINILERATLLETLSRLAPGDNPAFGSMTSQHMVEHLAFAVRFANGKEPQQHHYSDEKEQKIKAFVIGSDKDLPIGFKSPVLPMDELPSLRFSSLKDAIDNLQKELDDFDNHFVESPNDKPINPTMGELNYLEWIKFHNRHFTHHFKQFRLV